jgi:hypothetical protein
VVAGGKRLQNPHVCCFCRYRLFARGPRSLAPAPQTRSLLLAGGENAVITAHTNVARRCIADYAAGFNWDGFT